MFYKVVQPPFTLQFTEMTKPELRQYFAWFLKVMPERLQILGQAVSTTPGFTNLILDGSIESLSGLGEWFSVVAHERARTTDEISEIKSRSAFPIPVPATELSNQTFSIALDIGMYFSQLMLDKHPHMKWDQPLKDKKFIDYGQPVLIGAGRVPLNAVRLMVNLAYGLVSKAQTGTRLAEVFEYWSEEAAADPAAKLK